MQKWWGDTEVDQAMSCHVGPLLIDIRRLRGEWRIAWNHLGSDETSQATTPEPFPLTGAQTARFATSDNTDRRVSILPAMAPRPVIARPLASFSVLGGEEVALWVSLPVWVQVRFKGATSGKPVLDLPVTLPSDTWFGPSTAVGELCFATRTRAFRDPSDLVVRPHRVSTCVEIFNRGRDPLSIERLSVPAPHLSIMLDEDTGGLVTEPVRLEHDEGGQFANFTVKSGAGTLIAPPRHKTERNVMIRAFSSIFTNQRGTSY